MASMSDRYFYTSRILPYLLNAPRLNSCVVKFDFNFKISKFWGPHPPKIKSWINIHERFQWLSVYIIIITGLTQRHKLYDPDLRSCWWQKKVTKNWVWYIPRGWYEIHVLQITTSHLVKYLVCMTDNTLIILGMISPSDLVCASIW